MIKNLSNTNLWLVLIAFTLLIITSNINWGGEKWKGTLESDAKGYYAYNPAIFIYHDLSFNFFTQLDMEKYYNQDIFSDYRSFLNEGVVNKYYAGTAIAQSPFFLIAHFLSSILGQDADGYSKIYMQLIHISAIFYLIFGLFFLGRILKKYQIGNWQIILCFLAVTFGTNAFVYTIVEPMMSHIYSFAFISLFLFLLLEFIQFQKNIHLLLIGFSLGMIILIRPINGLVIFSIPLFVTSKKEFTTLINSILKKRWILLLSILSGGIIIFLQFIFYKISTNHFFIYSYAEEGFNFLDPQIFNILWSYKKGLFLYTPIYLISLSGLFFIFKKSKFQGFAWILLFSLITYVLSSWWMWFYGGSFSSRVYLDYLPYFIILLGISLKELKPTAIKKSFVSLIFAFIFLCQIQSYQYRYYILHYSEMTKEKYWDIFLKIK